MSAITRAPLFNVISERVQLTTTLGTLAVLERTEFDPSDLPIEVGEQIGTDSWEFLCRELTWVTIERTSATINEVRVVHSSFEVDEIATAIRLVTDLPVSAPFLWTEWTGERDREMWFQRGYSAVTSYPDRWMMAKVRGLLDDTPVRTEFGQRQWNRVQMVIDALGRTHPGTRRLNLAIGRYNIAQDRVDPRDSIIDLCIALEALLVSESYPTDLGSFGAFLNTKLRTALQMANRNDEISDIAEHYWVRNQIVHGKSSNFDALKTLGLLSRDTRKLIYELLMNKALLEPTPIPRPADS